MDCFCLHHVICLVNPHYQKFRWLLHCLAYFLLFLIFFGAQRKILKKSLLGVISNLEELEAKCLDTGCKNAEIIADNLDIGQQDIIDSKRNARRLLKRANKMSFAGKFLFCFGVFTFLVVVVGYDEIIRAFNAIKGFETRSSILAFGVIMLNYYMQDWILEKASNVLKKYNI